MDSYDSGLHKRRKRRFQHFGKIRNRRRGTHVDHVKFTVINCMDTLDVYGRCGSERNGGKSGFKFHGIRPTFRGLGNFTPFITYVMVAELVIFDCHTRNSTSPVSSDSVAQAWCGVLMPDRQKHSVCIPTATCVHGAGEADDLRAKLTGRSEPAIAGAGYIYSHYHTWFNSILFPSLIYVIRRMAFKLNIAYLSKTTSAYFAFVSFSFTPYSSNASLYTVIVELLARSIWRLDTLKLSSSTLSVKDRVRDWLFNKHSRYRNYNGATYAGLNRAGALLQLKVYRKYAGMFYFNIPVGAVLTSPLYTLDAETIRSQDEIMRVESRARAYTMKVLIYISNNSVQVSAILGSRRVSFKLKCDYYTSIVDSECEYFISILILDRRRTVHNSSLQNLNSTRFNSRVPEFQLQLYAAVYGFLTDDSPADTLPYRLRLVSTPDPPPTPPFSPLPNLFPPRTRKVRINRPPTPLSRQPGLTRDASRGLVLCTQREFPSRSARNAQTTLSALTVTRAAAAWHVELRTWRGNDVSDDDGVDHVEESGGRGWGERRRRRRRREEVEAVRRWARELEISLARRGKEREMCRCWRREVGDGGIGQAGNRRVRAKEGLKVGVEDEVIAAAKISSARILKKTAVTHVCDVDAAAEASGDAHAGGGGEEGGGRENDAAGI
ncbi:hypothetical protein R3P38DRAFT_3518327 [Favolaschia claudopus]|uniref:Uncharacterized protein n=1 Tax=Favolaschia claudopus TaxID=2862362 RepID=A0AAW0BQI9_9AGAR